MDPSFALHLRICSMQWAMQTATPGEDGASILARAMIYQIWIAEPMSAEAIKTREAEAERVGATVN